MEKARIQLRSHLNTKPRVLPFQAPSVLCCFLLSKTANSNIICFSIVEKFLIYYKSEKERIFIFDCHPIPFLIIRLFGSVLSDSDSMLTSLTLPNRYDLNSFILFFLFLFFHVSKSIDSAESDSLNLIDEFFVVVFVESLHSSTFFIAFSEFLLPNQSRYL